MITKTTTPLISDCNEPQIIGSQTEYRVFGLLIYRKILYFPNKYGIDSWDEYPLSLIHI